MSKKWGESVMHIWMNLPLRLCKLDCVFLVTWSVTIWPQSHFRCSGVQKSISVFLLKDYYTFPNLIFQPPRTCIPASEDFDRILWLWLVLTDSELWRTLAESFLHKVIPKRKIVSAAPTRAIDMAPNTLVAWRWIWHSGGRGVGGAIVVRREKDLKTTT